MHQLQSFGLRSPFAGREDFECVKDLSWNEFHQRPLQVVGQSQLQVKPHTTRLQVQTLQTASLEGFAVKECTGTTCAADAFLPSLIWACSRNKDLLKGTSLHNELQKRGLPEKQYSDALITMYAKCGELGKAQALLDMHDSSSNIPWTALIACYSGRGQGQSALDCYRHMRSKGVPVDVVTYICTLKACGMLGAIGEGKKIHDEILRQGLLHHNMGLGNALIDMYAKCGAVSLAQNVLEELPSRDVVSWSALIAGYAREGQGRVSLECFEKMQRQGIPPNAVTYTCLLKSCAAIGAIDKGKQIHDEILRQGLLKNDKVLGNALVDMYAKCGALSQAQSVLEKLPSRDVVSWSALIGGYASKGQGEQALECFGLMRVEGIRPNAVTYVCTLKACALLGAIDKGNEIHDEILRQGLMEHSVELGNALVDMYAKCGALPQAQSVLENLPSRNVVTWSALIAGYSQNGQAQQALECFKQMQREKIPPNAVTYASVLKCYAMLGAIDKGRKMHKEIVRQGLLDYDIVLGNALVDMYAKCGALHQAKNVLENLSSRNIVSWSALIAGYADNEEGEQALECFEQMRRESIPPDMITYVSVLKACAVIKAIDKGTRIYYEISRQGLLEHSRVLGNALVDMYVKCDALINAQDVLEKLPSRDVVSWNTLIGGYACKGQSHQALDCFKQMQHEGISPNEVTYLCVLKAYTIIGAIDEGKKIHSEILRQGLLEHDKMLGNALVDMYAKCGALSQAKSVLEKLRFHDVVAWNALIAVYAQQGQGEQALECFEQMQHEGILPDIVTFHCLLTLCSHHGLVEKAQELFDSLGATNGWKLDADCFTCMVGLYGRTGNLVKALEVIREMPSSANSTIFLCLLGACREWVDVNVGTLAFKQAVELDKCNGSAYVLMADIYAAAGMPEKAKDIEAMRLKNKAWKQPG